MRSISIGSIRSAAEVTNLRLPADACEQLSAEPSVGLDILEFSGRDGEPLGQIEFEHPFQGEQLDPANQNEFKSDLCREIARLEQWAADNNWPPSPAPTFQVTVSDRFKISKSLVPAWYGRTGRMEFPAWRVIARKAAIAHELVHVFFPNGNRLLAEGLAVYLQAEIGGNPAFPNFGRPLHELARERLRDMVPAFSQGDPADLEPVHVVELDAIATPSPLTLKVGNDFYGEEPRGQAHLYAIAGSFVQFLIESRGLAMFRKLYERTPLVPLQQNGGASKRWPEIYGLSLGELSNEWKLHIARHGELTED